MGYEEARSKWFYSEYLDIQHRQIYPPQFRWYRLGYQSSTQQVVHFKLWVLEDFPTMEEKEPHLCPWLPWSNWLLYAYAYARTLEIRTLELGLLCWRDGIKLSARIVLESLKGIHFNEFFFARFKTPVQWFIHKERVCVFQKYPTIFFKPYRSEVISSF